MANRKTVWFFDFRSSGGAKLGQRAFVAHQLAAGGMDFYGSAKAWVGLDCIGSVNWGDLLLLGLVRIDPGSCSFLGFGC